MTYIDINDENNIVDPVRVLHFNERNIKPVYSYGESLKSLKLLQIQRLAVKAARIMKEHERDICLMLDIEEQDELSAILSKFHRLANMEVVEFPGVEDGAEMGIEMLCSAIDEIYVIAFATKIDEIIAAWIELETMLVDENVINKGSDTVFLPST